MNYKTAIAIPNRDLAKFLCAFYKSEYSTEHQIVFKLQDRKETILVIESCFEWIADQCVSIAEGVAPKHQQVINKIKRKLGLKK